MGLGVLGLAALGSWGGSRAHFLTILDQKLAQDLEGWANLAMLDVLGAPTGRGYPSEPPRAVSGGGSGGGVWGSRCPTPRVPGPPTLPTSPQLFSGLVLGGVLGFQAPQCLSGWLRDLTGDFTASFLAAGAFLLAGSLLILTLPGFFRTSRGDGGKGGGHGLAPSEAPTVSPSTL